MANGKGAGKRWHRRSVMGGLGAVVLSTLSGCLGRDNGESEDDGTSPDDGKSGDDGSSPDEGSPEADESDGGDTSEDDSESSNSADPDVEIVAGYPDDSGEVTTEVVLEPDDFAAIEPARLDGGRPSVPVELTPEAADRFVTFLVDAGFTDEGVGACSFDADEHDEPLEGQYCLYTVLDGEYIYGASMSRDLAETLKNDRELFLEEPSLVLLTGSLEEAEELEAALRE